MEIYKKYKAKKKVIVHSTANHSEEREQHIIQGAFDHICDELSKTVYKGLSAIEIQKEKEGKVRLAIFSTLFSATSKLAKTQVTRE